MYATIIQEKLERLMTTKLKTTRILLTLIQTEMNGHPLKLRHRPC